MFTKNQNSVVRIMLVIAFFAGALGVQPAQAASVDFGWARGMGGTGYDGGYNIALDADGNVYVLGVFSNTVDFDPGAGISNLTSLGSTDVFINKFDNNGNFIWAKNLGGSLSDGGLGLAMDGSGNIYIAGYFHDTVDFDPGAGTHYLTSNGGSDIFIVKLDNNGGFVWAGSMGSASDDLADIVFGNSGSIYLTGRFGGTVDFDPGAGTYNLTSAGGWDIFVSKLDGDGNHVWTKSMGGISNDQAFEIVSDASGNVYTTGQFSGTADFDPGAGVNNLTSAGGRDIFVSKLDANGNFVWAKGMGGVSTDAGNDIVLDGNGYVYLAGDFDGTADFDPGAGTAFLTGSGISDVFISKLDNNGNFVWAKGIGGTNFDMGTSIALDGDGFLNVTGYFGNTVDFDPGTGVSNLTSTGDIDIFVAQFDSNGIFNWAKNMGGSFFEGGNDILVDGNRNIYVVGEFQNTVDFDPGAGTNNLASMGDNDIFIVKLNAVSRIHYVKWNAIGANNGSSWTDAYTDLQSALSAASAGDEIWVAAGTYKPTSGADRTISFVLKNGVAVYGGFAGGESSRDQRNFQSNVTILSGDIGTLGNIIDNTYHVVVGSNTDTSAVLDGFTITAGNANGAPPTQYQLGGGMYNYFGSPTVRNTIFSDNSASFGGGMYNYGDEFINQGKIFAPALTNVVFRNNSAEEGGGMRNENYSSPTLTNVTFESNSTIRTGGGMQNFGYSNPVLNNVTFINNTAGSTGVGGGMFNWAGSNPVLTDVTFNGNTANKGGGMGNYSSNPILTDVTFAGNSVTGDGGGMLNTDYSGPVLRNVTFSANSADSGGAMYNSFSGAILRNVTISGNIASGSGGGIYNYTNAPTAPSILNTIIWGNTGGEIVNANSDTPIIGYSIVQGGCPTGSDCTNIITTDPKLGALGNYGGFTQTIPLLAGSSAIDTGYDGVNCPTTDQRGVTRPQGSHCDIGAYEYAETKIPTRFPSADFNGDGKTDVAVFRPSNSTWYISGQGSFVYGQAGDIPVPADYNGDGKDDIAVFRPSNSTWYIYGVGAFTYGTVGDIPVVADYNGDGKDDIAVFRPTNSTWYIYGVGPFLYGTVGDIPVIADYNGDGKDDIAVFRPTNSTWYLYGIGPFVYGTVGDIPVIGDYNGDGKADIAVFRPSNSTWYIYGVGPSMYGMVGDIPVIGDYDGNGKADIAVFRPSNSTWYIYGVGPRVYGTAGDIPV